MEAVEGRRTVHAVDATGLSCPLPVIELSKAVERASVGDLIELRATDPAARIDVAVWCRMQRQVLHEVTEQPPGWRFLVERVR